MPVLSEVKEKVTAGKPYTNQPESERQTNALTVARLDGREINELWAI
jgi:hypothetical protein